MVNPQYPFKGQQVLTLIGSEQTTSLLVVMIVLFSVVERADDGGGETKVATPGFFLGLLAMYAVSLATPAPSEEIVKEFDEVANLKEGEI